MGRTKDRIEQIRWLPCLNVYGAEIPAFAAVRVTAATAGGVLSVSRPNADHQYVYLTGPTPIPTASYGICTRDTPIFAYYDTANTPAEGEAWGAKSGTFKLTKNYSGFYVHGGHGNERVYVRRTPSGLTQLDVTDVTLSSDQNNYSLPSTSILNVNASSSFSFTGFTSGGSTPTAGRTVEIANTGTGTITLPHESGSSSSANQVSTPTAASWEIPPKASVKLKYLGGKWLIADVPKIPAAHTSGGGGSGTGFTYYSSSGTTADAYADVRDSSGNMVFCWGTIRNTHGSNSLTVEETLEGAFGAAPGAGETPVAAGASYTIVATTHTSSEPLSRARYRVKSTSSGNHATWDSKIAAVVL